MNQNPWVLVAGGFHNQGGMDKANLALATYLADNGASVILVTHSADESIRENALVTVHTIPRPFNSYILAEPLLDIQGRSVARTITAQCPNAKIIVNGGCCIWPGINWAHYVHHAWTPIPDESSVYGRQAKKIIHKLEKRQERLAYCQAGLIVANSEITRRNILEHFTVDPDRVRTVYLGSDPTWGPVSTQERMFAKASLHFPENRLCAVFVGALGGDRRKGFDTLFAAWSLLCQDQAWDVDLLIAGDGPSVPEWRSRITKSGLAKRMRLLGFYLDIRQLLAASDLLISPARYEPYGLNVQEAICRGIPSIVSAGAGIAERYPKSLALFLMPDPEDVADLVERLKRWRSDVLNWKSRFEPLSLTLRSYSWRDMARDFVSLAADIPSANSGTESKRSPLQ